MLKGFLFYSTVNGLIRSPCVLFSVLVPFKSWPYWVLTPCSDVR